jgi:hypothetical protein
LPAAGGGVRPVAHKNSWLGHDYCLDHVDDAIAGGGYPSSRRSPMEKRIPKKSFIKLLETAAISLAGLPPARARQLAVDLHRRSYFHGVIKAFCPSSRQPDASVRSRISGEVARVQSVGRSDLKIVRHWCADEDGARRFRIFPHIHPGLDDLTIADIRTVEAGAMVNILADHPMPTDGRTVPFSSGGSGRDSDDFAPLVKKRLLIGEAHGNRSTRCALISKHAQLRNRACYTVQ